MCPVRVRVSASLNFIYFVLLNELRVISLVLIMGISCLLTMVLMVQYGAAIWCRSVNKQSLQSCPPECEILCCSYLHSGAEHVSVAEWKMERSGPKNRISGSGAGLEKYDGAGGRMSRAESATHNPLKPNN